MAFTAVLHREKIAISMDGRGTLAGQRVRRASVALREIRGGLPAGLWLSQRSPRSDRPLSDLPQ